MLDAIYKAKQLGSLAVERAADYVDLVRLEIEIAFNEAKARWLGFTLMVLGFLFALIFICVAVVITFWDTPYRVHVAWLIVAFFILLSAIGFLTTRVHPRPGAAFRDLHEELQKDIKLIKEII